MDAVFSNEKKTFFSICKKKHKKFNYPIYFISAKVLILLNFFCKEVLSKEVKYENPILKKN